MCKHSNVFSRPVLTGDWLDHFDIPYDRIWGEEPCGPGKPIALHYIDDRAIKFESWAQVMEEIK